MVKISGAMYGGISTIDFGGSFNSNNNLSSLFSFAAASYSLFD
jgi:hypothetical protein